MMERPPLWWSPEHGLITYVAPDEFDPDGVYWRCELKGRVSLRRSNLPNALPPDAEELAGTRDKVTADWDGLLAILDRHYPPEIFTGESGDEGPRIIALIREVDRFRRAYWELNNHVERTLAAALGYPKYGDVDDDPPGNPADYVIGDHVAESLASQAATELSRLQRETTEADRLRAGYAQVSAEAGRLFAALAQARRDQAGTGDTARSALADLVRLKDGPRDEGYRATKDAAWERARAVLTQLPKVPGDGDLDDAER